MLLCKGLKTLGILREMWLVVSGYVIESVMCVGVQCGENPVVFADIFYTTSHFLTKGDQNLMFFTLISPLPSISYGNSLENGIWMPKTQGKSGFEI